MTAAVPGPVNSQDDIRLALRSWPEVDDYLTSCKGVILPLGSTEQHGLTGAIGTDALTAEAVALEVGVTPVCWSPRFRPSVWRNITSVSPGP